MTKATFTRAAIQAAASPKGRPCGLKLGVATLTGAEQKEFAEAMTDWSLPLSAIAAVLATRGIKINTTSLHHHRHGRCGKCYGVPV